MILYDTSITMSLEPFGILIPVRDSRSTRTFAALKRHPKLGPIIEKWHAPAVTERLSREDLLRVHSPAYVQRLFSDRLEEEILSTYELIATDGGYHRYAPETAQYPLDQLFERMLIKAAGSTQCGRLALAHGFCFYFGGGMHHAYRDHGSGFCMINDIVIAARKLQAENAVQRVWIIDVDAHKGDGTAALAADDNSIVTLSVHMATGWPLDGPRHLKDGTPNPVFTPSDIDIPIEAGEEGAISTGWVQGSRRWSGWDGRTWPSSLMAPILMRGMSCPRPRVEAHAGSDADKRSNDLSISTLEKHSGGLSYGRGVW